MTDKYHVILADPPWSYAISQGDHRWGGRGERRIRHYHGMTQREMLAIPVREIAAPDAALFMWATMPCLTDAMELMVAWGFTYKTVAFTWMKTNRNGTPYMGMGHYTRANAELCLLGLRGKMARKSKSVPQAMLFPRREHSRKPDQQYGRIMRLFDGPYLEMFARQRWPGWDVWGNQTDLFPAQTFLFDEVSTWYPLAHVRSQTRPAPGLA